MPAEFAKIAIMQALYYKYLEAKMGAPITDNAYGNPSEEDQRGPRSLRGDKLPQKATAPHPKQKGK